MPSIIPSRSHLLLRRRDNAVELSFCGRRVVCPDYEFQQYVVLPQWQRLRG